MVSEQSYRFGQHQRGFAILCNTIYSARCGEGHQELSARKLYLNQTFALVEYHICEAHSIMSRLTTCNIAVKFKLNLSTE